MINTTPQPSAAKISGCIEQITQIAASAANQQDMLEARAQVTSLAAGDVEVYHYCFYQLMKIVRSPQSL